jgi:tRNA nucleotidyltransferase/poly(A) polymerase
MADPVIVPRAEHPISRKDIDPDALKVLYRLNDFNHAAYLVGGGVRDLLLGRRPKDFDVGTDAHPYQIKKLFRNCWIIGRRFRLAHVRFGNKTIEVATFRRQVEDHEGSKHEGSKHEGSKHEGSKHEGSKHEGSKHEHENTFGTPEEDAFRRDFTINALFYDIGTFSVIDYVGGLEDLKRRVIRSIGDPMVRFQEDPVRMLRAVAIASRLDFTLDPPIVRAINRERHLIATAAPARLIEEYYKILRSGSAERTFRSLAEHGLLEPVTPELQRRATHPQLWTSLQALDTYRLRFDSAPATLTNPVLLGSVLVPIGLMPSASGDTRTASDGTDRSNSPSAPGDLDGTDRSNSPMAASALDGTDRGNSLRAAGALDGTDRSNSLARARRTTALADSDESEEDDAIGNRDPDDDALAGQGRRRWGRSARDRSKPPVLKIGVLPIARRDSERLRQILSVQNRLRDLESSPRTKRALMQRGPFDDGLTWIEIHGNSPEVVEHWRGFIEALGAQGEKARGEGDADREATGARDGRRRRRRGGRRRGGRAKRPRES